MSLEFKVDSLKSVESDKLKVKKRKRLVWCFALLALLPLLVFKYYNFLNDSISEGLASIGLQFALPGLNWAIPVGISFFTFQAVGYMLDVYHGRVKAEKNLLDYLLFVSFFLQVMSGPISKADELLPQIKTPHRFDYAQGRQGLKQLLWGMFIKLVIADRLGLIVDTIFGNYIHYNGAVCFMGSVFYTLQIYCDFAGYSLMAVGIARTLGFNLIDNFRRPYFATSITDFWKRWHISLTRWLTQQVYIPLGGSRCSKARTYWNIFVTFLVSGIWHGANWTFIVWGCMHGLFQIVEKALGWQKYEGRNRAVKAVRIVVTFLLVNFAWVFFRMPSIGDAWGVLTRIFSAPGHLSLYALGGINNLLLVAIGVSVLVFKDMRDEFMPMQMRWLLLKIALFFVIVAAVDLGYGKVGDYLRDHAKGGVAAKVHYICEECNEDVMMMGSSRMAHHYVPQVFEDSLGMTCYNAGMDGNGILLSYGFLEMMLERYHPKKIIYDVSGFDLYTDDNTKYLDFMKPYYWKEHESVAGIFKDVDEMERWKMLSSLYRYNSKLFQMLGDNLHPLPTLEKGYDPLFRTMDYDPPLPSAEAKRVDSLKIQYLRKFIAKAQENDVELLFVASPTWHGLHKTADNTPRTLLSEELGVDFMNCYYDSLVCSSHEYWADATHMNDNGARQFSEELATILKNKGNK